MELSPEQYLISMAKKYFEVDKYKSKAWLLTATTLFRNNFAIQKTMAEGLLSETAAPEKVWACLRSEMLAVPSLSCWSLQNKWKPGSQPGNLAEALESIPTNQPVLIMGDINIDSLTKKNDYTLTNEILTSHNIHRLDLTTYKDNADFKDIH
ncbi:hypothetical protein J6590_076553 [Homalodisca vitripennis]|nr:hypothetical protein J6590_076553 [Homalodisca vitripennis]